MGETSSLQKQHGEDGGGGHAGTFRKAVRGPLSWHLDAMFIPSPPPRSCPLLEGGAQDPTAEAEGLEGIRCGRRRLSIYRTKKRDPNKSGWRGWAVVENLLREKFLRGPFQPQTKAFVPEMPMLQPSSCY